MVRDVVWSNSVEATNRIQDIKLKNKHTSHEMTFDPQSWGELAD